MIIIVAGPTASGKSALGISLAQELNGEVINIDSVQLYDGFRIGAATVPEEERQGIPHHLVGVVSPNEAFDVAQYCSLAEQTLKDVERRGKQPIFVGGTSLYISALIGGLTPLPKAQPLIREELEMKSNEELHALLATHDASTAQRLHPNDRVRIIRALETVLITSTELSAAHAAAPRQERDAVVVCPMWSRDALYNRIDERTRSMIDAGLVREVADLCGRYNRSMPAFRSIGYAEALRALDGKISDIELEAEIAQATRRFAKRQMTWLRNQPNKLGWGVRPTENDPRLDLTGDLARFAKPRRLKHFAVWDLDKLALVQEIQRLLTASNPGVQMLFVPGSKVL